MERFLPLTLYTTSRIKQEMPIDLTTLGKNYQPVHTVGNLNVTLYKETLNEETLNEETLNEETLNEETLNEETLNEENVE